MIRSGWNSDVLDSGYRSYLDTSLSLRIADHFLRGRLVRPFLDRFYDQPNFDAVGFKLMLNQTRRRRFPMVVPYLIEKQVSVIHVVRENVLKTHLSRLMASHRRVYHATEQATELPKLTVPIEDLASSLQQIEAEGAAWKNVFGGQVPLITLSYERFTVDSQMETERVLSFLELPAAKLHSPLVRISPDDPAQIVSNWTEVQHYLRDTPYARWAV